MKNIHHTLVVGALSILGILSYSPSSYARDSIDWEDMKVTYTYDYNDEELDIRVSVDEDTHPDDRYTARFKIDGETYNRDFTYDSNKDELYFEYSLDIDNNDLEDEYDIDIRVTNESRDEFEYEDVLNGSVGNVVDWDNLEISSDYNSSSQYLRIELTLDDIDENPNETYYSYFKLDGKTHTAAFRYSSSDDKYYATHTIYIDRDDIEDDYDYELSIKSRNYRIVYEDEGNLEVDGYAYNSDKKNSSKENFSWDNLTVSNYYNSSTQELNVVFMVPNVYKTPSKSYFAVLEFNGHEYTKKLTYMENQNRLYASITFNVGYIKNSYNVNYSVVSSSQTVYGRENVKMNINRPGISNNGNSSSIQKYNTDALAQKIINFADERYIYSEDKIYYLENVIKRLQTRYGQSKYKAIINAVNLKLREKINQYKQTQYYEEELFDLDTIDWR